MVLTTSIHSSQSSGALRTTLTLAVVDGGEEDTVDGQSIEDAQKMGRFQQQEEGDSEAARAHNCRTSS